MPFWFVVVLYDIFYLFFKLYLFVNVVKISVDTLHISKLSI